MDHSAMDHGAMDHSAMDHGAMDHSAMDHSAMGHGTMDHGGMDHGPGHTMQGIPTWMAIGGVVFIIIATHLLLAFRPRRKDDGEGLYPRFNLFRFGPLKKLVKLRFFPLLAQWISIFLFGLVIAAGLFGSARVNIAPVLTWTWWWVLLIFFVLGFGKVFCAICPWEGLSSLVTSLSLRSRKKRLGFERKWPRNLRNVYLAMGLFVLLTWFELGLDITRSPSSPPSWPSPSSPSR